MLQQTKAWQSYRQVATQTASPGQLVLLLYNGIIRFLEQARLGFGIDDPKEFNETINNNLQRALAIINEMNQSLNMAEGGEFAVRMRALYDYFDRHLHESNMNKTEEGILEVLKHVTILRDAWAEMLQKGAGTVDTAMLARSSVTALPGPGRAVRTLCAMAKPHRRGRGSHRIWRLDKGGALPVRQVPPPAPHRRSVPAD